MKIRTVEKPTTYVQHFYTCEGCGVEYGNEDQAKWCESKHVRDACSHPSDAQRWQAKGGSIDRTCGLCGQWFDDDANLDGLTDDQPTLRALVAAIRAAKAGGTTDQGKGQPT